MCRVRRGEKKRRFWPGLEKFYQGVQDRCWGLGRQLRGISKRGKGKERERGRKEKRGRKRGSLRKNYWG